MYDSSIDPNDINLRSWITLGVVGLGALAIAILFSPAAGLYDLGPAQKQIAASGR
ncbi:hypothetical protein CCC_03973 [Paramagnetospirillum magnetotacticum MS-1]|uniref:Uncharacterized protein n=1 Tax=Paramagnetospirillum magnetotacticum MS-1 TaxID=272627 RepID=A0A0C2UD80_PARME|nr:hypothetical protein [Paramagnetospirillum magnetotacticum]KIL99457.1 hypothetical protein CCC_03973 [Paramagnetospirillum magnetotacticum MS-1]